MAYLLLPLNGVGRGHLTRALIFADWLREAGRLPMIALQGAARFAASRGVPTTNVPTLHHAVAPNAQRVADDLARAALLSSPAVIIEDTHPRRVRWPPGIHHVVVVRPTHIDHMRLLTQLRGDTSRLLICDHPSSPTWPYDAAQTAEILSWPRWDCLGPVFRALGAESVDRMRAKYRLGADEELFVFSMGGGGELEGSGDRLTFLAAASAMAGQLRARVARPRFVFVRGPLFPPDLALPAIFEDVHEEPDLPALFALATGAIVRPGYNVTWECIAAGTPFLALRGTTKSEPVQVRLDALAASGFEISPDVDRLVDPVARARFAAACRTALARFDGVPRARFLAHAEPPPAKPPPQSEPRRSPPGAAFPTAQLDRLARAVRDAGAPVPLRIRIDDVTRLDGEVSWVIALCREHRAWLSLEVVPYHNAITGAELDQLDPDGVIDVSQHGYAHLPEYSDGVELRGELLNAPDGRLGEQLGIGATLLASAFGSRFRGGYSAPYDQPPPGLSSTWRAVGGRYLSWMWRRPEGDELPRIRLGIDPWNWKVGHPQDAAPLVDRIITRMPHHGGVGVVLHPQCLREPDPRQMTADLLRCLLEAGCVPTRIDPHPA